MDFGLSRRERLVAAGFLLVGLLGIGGRELKVRADAKQEAQVQNSVPQLNPKGFDDLRGVDIGSNGFGYNPHDSWLDRKVALEQAALDNCEGQLRNIELAEAQLDEICISDRAGAVRTIAYGMVSSLERESNFSQSEPCKERETLRIREEKIGLFNYAPAELNGADSSYFTYRPRDDAARRYQSVENLLRECLPNMGRLYEKSSVDEDLGVYAFLKAVAEHDLGGPQELARKAIKAHDETGSYAGALQN